MKQANRKHYTLFEYKMFKLFIFKYGMCSYNQSVNNTFMIENYSFWTDSLLYITLLQNSVNCIPADAPMV